MLAKIPIVLNIVKQRKVENFWMKNVKIRKRSQAYMDYASIYSVEILNSFSLKLQLKDT